MCALAFLFLIIGRSGRERGLPKPWIGSEVLARERMKTKPAIMGSVLALHSLVLRPICEAISSIEQEMFCELVTSMIPLWAPKTNATSPSEPIAQVIDLFDKHSIWLIRDLMWFVMVWRVMYCSVDSSCRGGINSCNCSKIKGLRWRVAAQCYIHVKGLGLRWELSLFEEFPKIYVDDLQMWSSYFLWRQDILPQSTLTESVQYGGFCRSKLSMQYCASIYP